MRKYSLNFIIKEPITREETMNILDFRFIFVQLLGLIPSIIAFTSLQSNNRKRILLLQVGCCFMWGFHYGLLGAYTAVLTNIVGLLRAALCYNNDKPWAKNKFWLYLLLFLYATCAAVTWDGFYCLLPCISMMLSTVALWTHNMKTTRLLFLLNSPPLLFYGIATKSYSCAAIEVCALISFIIAIYRFDIRKPQKEKIVVA